MKLRKIVISALCLSLIVASSGIPLTSWAQEKPKFDDEVVLRVNTTDMAGPIGFLRSVGTPSINGRPAVGQSLIWGSELIQVPQSSSATIHLNGVGQVNLTGGSAARIGTGSVPNGENTVQPVLVASLIRGSLSAALEPPATATVFAAGTAYEASNGSSFHVRINAEGSHAEADRGGIQDNTQLADQRKFILRPVQLGAKLDARTRSTYRIQIQVNDEHDKPVPDMPVLLLLIKGGSLNGGSSSASVVSNAQGIATFDVQVGDTPGSLDYKAQIEGNSATPPLEVSIPITQPPVPFFSFQNPYFVIPLAAASITAPIAAKMATNGGRGRLGADAPGSEP